MPTKQAPPSAKPTKVTAPKSPIDDLITAKGSIHPLIRTHDGYNYKYADLKDVFDSCESAFRVNNFAIYHINGQDKYGMYVTTVLHHRSNEKFESKVYLVMGKNDMQALGSAITYARRYGLLSLAGMAAEDDDGEATKGSDLPEINKSQSYPRKNITAASSPKPF